MKQPPTTWITITSCSDLCLVIRGWQGQGSRLGQVTYNQDLEAHHVWCLQDFLCLRGAQGENIFDVSSTVKLICNNSSCSQSRFMHRDCFETWQDSILNYLNKTKEGQKKVRNWSEKQKLQNLWKPQGYNLVIEACSCRCGGGQLRKDLNWVPPKASNNSGNINSRGGLKSR